MLGRTSVAAAAILAALVTGLAAPAWAKVFYAREEALRAAFPEADTIEKEIRLLSDDQARQIEGIARAKLESRMVTIHVGKKNQQVLGYALIDIHVVRTQPEAVMVVLTPEGVVESTLIVAFHEPLDYLPPPRWLKQFPKRTLASDLGLGHGIAAITGATLSANGVTESVRRALAVYQVLLAPKKP
jgi:hypothetical protein